MQHGLVTKAHPVSITLYGDDAERVRRVVAMVPALTANRIGARAVRAGIDAVEAELREAARKLVGSEAP